jgi:DNA-binding transcriptional ArsR family regulator
MNLFSTLLSEPSPLSLLNSSVEEILTFLRNQEVKVSLRKCLSQMVCQILFDDVMSSSEEDSYSMIFSSLKHPIRRKILRILSSEAQSFSDLQKQFDIESSHLTYHIEGLGNLLSKSQDGRYTLSSLGEAAVSIMKNVEEPPSSMHLPAAQTLSKGSRKKNVSRAFAVGLVIVCLVLAASLVGAIYTWSIENSKVQNLNAILTHEKVVSETWLDNATFSLLPQGNVTKLFYTPYSGVVRVQACISPPNPDWSVSLIWYSYFDYQLYGTNSLPYILGKNSSSIDVEFTIASIYGSFSPTLPNISIIICNNSTESLTARDVNITLYY